VQILFSRACAVIPRLSRCRKAVFNMLLSIIRSVVVFDMSVDMYFFNNLMYALNTESVCLNFGVLKEGNLVLTYL